jgi:hypothetical protein
MGLIQLFILGLAAVAVIGAGIFFLLRDSAPKNEASKEGPDPADADGHVGDDGGSDGGGGGDAGGGD